MAMTLKVVFHEHGFEVGKDISFEELEKLREQFVTMSNLFADGANAALEKLNKIWEQYEYILKIGNVFDIRQTQEAMGIESDTDYNDWIAKWYQELANCVDLSFTDTRLKSYIFRDDGVPIYGVQFKDHPDWTMDITLEQM